MSLPTTFFDESKSIANVKIITDPTELLSSFSSDKSHRTPTQPPAIAFLPTTIPAVVNIVKLCSKYKLPMITRGAGTGLEGGCIPCDPRVCIIDTSDLKRLEVDVPNLRCWVGAGVRKMALNAELEKHGMLFGPDPASNPSLGGMASTAGSGMSTLRYGTTRENVIALKVVTPEGNVIQTRRAVRKSSTGLDLTQLYCGSEGTLGIIVELCVKIFPKQSLRSGGIAIFDTTEKAVATAVELKRSSLSHLVRCELMNAECVKTTNKYFNMKLKEIPTIFFELQCNNQTDLDTEFKLISDVCKKHGGTPTYYATGDALDDVWEARRGCYIAALKYRGNKQEKVYCTDVCVPLSHLSQVVQETEADFASHGMECIICAHISDGNFHCNIPFASEQEKVIVSKLENNMVKRAQKYGGTASGEHGVGLGKIHHLCAEHGEHHIEIQRKIKAALDPDNLMNPGKFYPAKL